MADPYSGKWIQPAVILVATDLSDLDRLMPFALEQAAQSGARLILLHAIASSASLSVDAVGLPYYDLSSAVEVAEKALRPWRVIAQNQRIAVAINRGSGGEQLTERAGDGGGICHRVSFSRLAGLAGLAGGAPVQRNLAR